MSIIASVAKALPVHRYAQAELTAILAELTGLAPDKVATLDRIHANAGVEHRHLAVPIENIAQATSSFDAANDAFIDAATDLGEQAVCSALELAGVSAHDVDVIISMTVTGLAVPSLDARLCARLPFRSDLKRVPIVGLGCVGGAAGIARADDYLAGHPDEVVIVLSVELCSLTLQRDDVSMANLIASGLFGDGAAAVVLFGEHAAQRHVRHTSIMAPQVVSSRSRMYADTHRAMGWDIGASGLRIVLGAEVPDLVRDHVRDDIDAHLKLHDLIRDDIGWYVAHPGGPKVLDALAEALEVPSSVLGVTWRSLAQIGNLSSSSVLHVLADTLADHRPEPGSWGILMAMGPGFCLETVLLRAPEN